jgi:hypothetical protein
MIKNNNSGKPIFSVSSGDHRNEFMPSWVHGRESTKQKQEIPHSYNLQP